MLVGKSTSVLCVWSVIEVMLTLIKHFLLFSLMFLLLLLLPLILLTILLILLIMTLLLLDLLGHLLVTILDLLAYTTPLPTYTLVIKHKLMAFSTLDLEYSSEYQWRLLQ